jgi:hypothetical protein
MNIVKATSRFEEWLDRHIVLVKEDLRLKHEQMARSAFPFFRATFYRWIQIWPEICSVPADAPRVLAVGDLHVENFGTWRDVEGRLIWGVNDFDEATVQPFTVDLIRLATSVLLASREGHLRLPPKDACQAILDGYVESLAGHGRPFVLAEQNVWLRDIATNVLRDPEHFWQKMDSYPTVRSEVPASAVEALEHLMPEPGLEYRLARRVAGLGSLGHIRLVAIAPWRGGRVAREAKSLAPSAVYWARDEKGPQEIDYQTILSRAVRCPDPFVQLRGRWIVRRLAPYCSRIELAVLPANRQELRLLYAMGFETANVHLGSKDARKIIRRHLKKLKANWLLIAAHDMAEAVTKDWRVWRQSYQE